MSNICCVMTSTGVKNLINLNEVKFSRGLLMKVTYHSVYIDYDLKLKTRAMKQNIFHDQCFAFLSRFNVNNALNLAQVSVCF